MPECILKIKGKAIPLRGNDIDTDRIIPARYLKCITFDGLGNHVFEDDRLGEKNRFLHHPFDDPKYQKASILFVNKNFGCGSSREHAPQAIKRFGIQCIIGESFAEIFFGNCIALGIPCFTLSEQKMDQWQSQVETHPETFFEVDVDGLTLSHSGQSTSLNMSSIVKDQFVKGYWDITGCLMEHKTKIKETAAQLPYMNWGIKM